MSDLIITNGDAAAELLTAAGLAGRMVVWRDVLHEGPLVPTEGHEALSDIRASYLSERFGLPYADVRTDFVARDAVLRAHPLFDRVFIWVEHDLYDQLQLLQILAFFSAEARTEGIVLVQADDFLGNQKPETILRFADRAVPVTPALLQAGAEAWKALLEPTPRGAERIAAAPARGLPFLRPALNRFLQELPAAGTGLSRTEHAALTALATRSLTPQALFGAVIEGEEAAFMGDWSLYRTLDDLAFAADPLVTGLDAPYPCRGEAASVAAYLRSRLALTPFGKAVLAGRADHVATNGIDRWWAGTHLSGTHVWRRDSATGRLVPPGER